MSTEDRSPGNASTLYILGIKVHYLSLVGHLFQVKDGFHFPDYEKKKLKITTISHEDETIPVRIFITNNEVFKEIIK
jgi:hypothetical protein